MKRYEWNYDGDIETFFARLQAATFQSIGQTDKKGSFDSFVWSRKSNNRFKLYYHKYDNVFNRRRGNQSAIFLLGKIRQTSDGVIATATLRTYLPIYIYMIFWFSALLFGIYNTLFIEPWLSASAFPLSIVLLISILIAATERKRSNAKGIIELMDNLRYTVLPEPDPEQKEKCEPRKMLTREEMFYRTPNKYTVPTKMYTTPDKPPVTNKSDAGGKSSK